MASETRCRRITFPRLPRVASPLLSSRKSPRNQQVKKNTNNNEPKAPVGSPKIRRRKGNGNKVKRKKVQFPIDEWASDEYIEPNYVLTDALCDDVWWSAEERIESDLERRHLAREFRNSLLRTKRRGHLDREFERLYESCSTLNVTQVLRNETARYLLKDVFASDAGLRGLESKLSNVLSKRRKQHVASMLSVFSSSTHGDDGGSSAFSVSTFETDGTDSTMTSAIHKDKWPEKLKRSSRASEILARAIAVMDAKQAQEMN